MPDDLNLPPTTGNPQPIPEPTPAPRVKRCDCEFCDCTLTTSGEVLKLSDKARKFRDHDETIARLEKELAQAKTEAGKLREQLAALTAPSGRRSHVAVVGK